MPAAAALIAQNAPKLPTIATLALHTLRGLRRAWHGPAAPPPGVARRGPPPPSRRFGVPFPLPVVAHMGGRSPELA